MCSGSSWMLRRRSVSSGSSITQQYSSPMPDAVQQLAAQVAEVAGADVELERPKDAAHGDYATNVALRSAKAIGRPPRELAQELAAKAEELPEIAAAEV